jgi:hypothetical protein
LARGGAWLASAFLALLAMAATKDGAFSVHMAIVAIVAMLTLLGSTSSFDFVALRFPALSQQKASTYDDDLISWSVVGTMFWGLAGFLAELFIVLAAAGYLFGVSQGKEYAEPEW